MCHKKGYFFKFCSGKVKRGPAEEITNNGRQKAEVSYVFAHNRKVAVAYL